MNASPRGDLEVFDVKEEDEIADIASAKQLAKFTSPGPDDQSVLKYEFLGCVSHVDMVSKRDAACISCVDIDTDAVKGNLNMEKGVSDPPLDILEEKLDDKEKDSELEANQQSNSISHELDPVGSKLDIHDDNGSIEPDTKETSNVQHLLEMSQIDMALSRSPSSNEFVDTNSEADDCMNESSPSSSASDIEDNVSFSGIGCNHCIGNSDLDDVNMEVVLYPDYMIYQDNYYIGSKLTFSHHCIKINGSTACINQGAINLEWAADDLIDIKCQLFQSNGQITIKLHVISSNEGHSENISSSSGFEELKIAVVDSNWFLRHKQIASLNVKYSDIWNIVLDTDMEGNENVLPGPRCYFPNFDEPFDEIIYPEGDPDAVSLSKRDVDLLQPDTFINDTVIDFYIKYLKNQIKEEEKHRFHFFNSFFFRKLVDMDKNPSSASDGKAAFQRVRKWTRKINLFEKDYIFIPVNFNLHWSLIVICHPGEVVSFNDDDLDKSPRVPCILHMDSIKGCHSGLKSLVQSYLWEEWKERHKEACEELSSRFLNMRFLLLALPQQENSFDCGLFLLHYLELFLAEAPANFSPFKLTKFSNFLNVDWFPPAEAYLKRTLIQRLIFDLLENRACEIYPALYGDHHYSKNDDRSGVKFLGQRCSPENNGESAISHADQGIEITLLSASSTVDPQSCNNSGLVLRELFEPGVAEGGLLGQCQSFEHRTSDYRLNDSLFPIEEDTESSEHYMYTTTNAKFQQVTPQTCEFPYISRGCGAETCRGPEISLLAEHDKAESLDTDDSGDVGIIENFATGNEARSSEEGRGYEKSCLSVENMECYTEIAGSAASNLQHTAVAGSSQNFDALHDSNKNGVLYSSCQETLTTPLHQISDAVDDKVSFASVQMANLVTPDFCDEKAAKRRRIMPLDCENDSDARIPSVNMDEDNLEPS